MERHVQVIETFDDFFMLNTHKRVLVLYGGAGSGKSHQIAYLFVKKFLSEKNKTFLISRKIYGTLKLTCMKYIFDEFDRWGFPWRKLYNKTDARMDYNGNIMVFRGMDDPEKIKSAEFNYIWTEEATDFDYDDYLMFDLRLRAKTPDGENNQLYLSFNPIDQFHWAITDLVQKPVPNMAVHHSTHRDNPFLNEEYRKVLEDFATKDENHYRIYCLGEPGVLQNIIYTNYTVMRDEMPVFQDVIYGLDFGYNNPTAMIEVGINDGRLFLSERLYEPGLTNSQLIGKLKGLHILPTAPIYADAAEPARIQEIRRAGFNVYPANKDIIDGIDHVKDFHLNLNPYSANLIGEIRGYSYREDKDKRVLEEPVKFRDHLMDAMRYAIHTHLTRTSHRGTRRIVAGEAKW